MRLRLPRVLRLIMLLFTSGLLMTTACLAIARRVPSQQYEMIVQMNEGQTSTSFYRFIPTSHRLMPIVRDFELVSYASMEADHQLLVLGRRDDRWGPYQVELMTGRIQLMAELPPIAISSSYILAVPQYIGNQWLAVTTLADLFIFDRTTHTLLTPTRQLPDNAYVNIPSGFDTSPDQQWVAFTAIFPDQPPDVYIARADGSDLRNLTSFINEPVGLERWVGGAEQWLVLNVNDNFYRIHPDGTGYMALTEGLTEEDAVYGRTRLSVNGEGWLILTRFAHDWASIESITGINVNNPARQWSGPAPICTDWPSADSAWLFYIVDNQLFRIRPDGTEQAAFANLPSATSYFNSWSPDYQWMTMSNLSPDGALITYYRLSMDGKSRQRIGTLDTSIISGGGWWSPDARWLAYQQAPSSYDQEDLWRIRAEGGKPERLLSGSAAKTLRFENWLGWGRRIDQNWSPVLGLGMAGGLLGMTLVATISKRYLI